MDKGLWILHDIDNGTTVGAYNQLQRAGEVIQRNRDVNMRIYFAPKDHVMGWTDSHDNTQEPYNE